jgi:hypothetical protein
VKNSTRREKLAGENFTALWIDGRIAFNSKDLRRQLPGANVAMELSQNRGGRNGT